MTDLAVPPALAHRLRALATQCETDANTLLRILLEAFLDYRETGWRSDHWRLSIVESDDGPTPPTGLEKVFDDYPRWRALPDLADVDDAAETPGADPSIDPSVDPTSEEPAGNPSCTPCILWRDDAVAVRVSFLPATKEVVVLAMTRDRHDQAVLELERCEAWTDFSGRVWRQVMDAADHLADALQTQPNPGDSPQGDGA